MAQTIRCPQCGNFSQTLPAAVAQVVACPHCGQRLRVPVARSEAAPWPVAQAAESAASAPQAAPRAADDGIPGVAPIPSGERRFDEQPRERAPRRRDGDDELPPRRRPGPRGPGYQPADPFASVQFGLGFFWWKNLLLIIAVLASFLPAGFSQLAGAGPIFAVLVLLIVAVGGLGTVAALIFGAIGGVCCNRLPEELRHARGLTSPLRTMEIVFPIVSLLSGLLLVLVMLSRPRFIGQPAPPPGYELFGYGFLAFGVLAFLCWLATYVLLLLFLRTLAKHYGDEDTAAKSIWVMIGFLVAAVAGPAGVFVTALLSRMLGFGMVTAFIAISAVGIVVTVAWTWILFKIMQTITTVRRHLAQSMRA